MIIISHASICAVLADADLPLGTGVVMVLFFAAVTAVSFVGLLASDEKLLGMARIVGTDKPKVARTICGVAGIVSAVFVGVAILAMLGKLD